MQKEKYEIVRKVQIFVDIMEACIIRTDEVITLHIMQFVNCDKPIFIFIHILKQYNSLSLSLPLLSGDLLSNTALGECDIKFILYLYGLICSMWIISYAVCVGPVYKFH